MPGGEDQEDSNYEILSTNEFHGVDPAAIKAKEDSWCSCQAPEGKGEIVCLQNCDNRAKRVECSVMLNNEYVLSQNLKLHVLPISVDLAVEATAFLKERPTLASQRESQGG